MDTKDLGVVLGGLAVVAGLSYARNKSESFAEFSTRRGKLLERALEEYGKAAGRYREDTSRLNSLVDSLDEGQYRRASYSDAFGVKSAYEKVLESDNRFQNAYKDLIATFEDAAPQEQDEAISKLPGLKKVPSARFRNWYPTEVLMEAWTKG